MTKLVSEPSHKKKEKPQIVRLVEEFVKYYETASGKTNEIKEIEEVLKKLGAPAEKAEIRFDPVNETAIAFIDLYYLDMDRRWVSEAVKWVLRNGSANAAGVAIAKFLPTDYQPLPSPITNRIYRKKTMSMNYYWIELTIINGYRVYLVAEADRYTDN